jgi:hypothetical protein
MDQIIRLPIPPARYPGVATAFDTVGCADGDRRQVDPAADQRAFPAMPRIVW